MSLFLSLLRDLYRPVPALRISHHEGSFEETMQSDFLKAL